MKTAPATVSASASGRVVDAAEQYRLIEERACRCREIAQGSDHWRINLPGMIRVDDDDNPGAQSSQRQEQPPVHPFRQDDGDPGVQPDPLYMGHAVEGSAGVRPSRASLSTSGSPPLRMISSREGSSAMSRSAAVEVPGRGAVLRVGVLPAEAVTTVDGAGARCDQQRPPGVLLQQARAPCARQDRRPGRRRSRWPAASSARVGRTCSSRGSRGSRGRIRAAKPRGTRSGKAARPSVAMDSGASPHSPAVRPRACEQFGGIAVATGEFGLPEGGLAGVGRA